MRYLLLASTTLLACAHAPAPPVPAPEVVSIRVEHVGPDAAWRVTWRLPRDVKEVRLVRPGHGDRTRRWQISTPGLRLETIDEVDRIVSEGPLFRTFEAHVLEFARKPEKDYQAFIPFLDGSVLLFTGTYDVEPSPGAPPWTIAFQLVPRPGETVVIGGARHEVFSDWSSRGDGTYALFGNTPSVETPLGLALVDGGMPAWLRERTLALAPRLFALYAERTGHRLAERPTFFLSYGREADAGSFSFGGGTLPGVVQLDARMGSRFAGEGDPMVWERQARLLAHEAAHLWLDQAFEPAPGSSRWLDEGGADAFALRALLDLGIVSPERFQELLSGDLAECLLFLDAGPLTDAARAGRWTALYRCGEVASFLADAAGARRSPSWDLFQFWGEVFRGAKDRVYDEALWLWTLSALPGGDREAAAVRRLVRRPDAALGADLADLLRIESWPTRPSTP